MVSESKLLVTLLFIIAFSSIFLTNYSFGTAITVGSIPFNVSIDQDSHKVFVVNQGSNSVSVIDGSQGSPTENEVIATIPVGNGPVAAAFNPVNKMLYTANQGSNTISVIDTLTNSVVANVTVGSAPVGVDVNPNTNMIYAGNIFSGTVSVINGTTNTVVSTIPLATGASRLSVDKNLNTIYVGNFLSNVVYVINGSTNTLVKTITVQNGPGVISANSITHYVYAANSGSNSVSVINGSTNTVVSTIPVGINPDGLGIDTNTNKIYVSNGFSNAVSVIDGLTNAITATIPVTSPGGLAVDSNTHRIYVVNFGSNTVTLIDTLSNTPPIADAGTDQIVAVSSLVTLNGTASSDADGDTISFHWIQTLGPSVILSDPTSSSPSFTAPQVNFTTVLSFQLTVNDGTFDSTPSSVNVIVFRGTTFVIPLAPTNGLLQGNVSVGSIFNGTTITLRYVPIAGSLPSSQFQQTVLPIGVNGSNVAFNVTESNKAPSNVQPPPLEEAIYFEIDSSGIDLSESANFVKDQSPLTKFLVSSSQISDKNFSDDCPVVKLDLFNETTGKWDQIGDPLASPSNKIYAANSGSNTLSIINGSTNVVEKNLVFPGGVHGQVYNPKTNLLYATNPLSNTISVLDGASDNVIATIPVGTSPLTVDLDPDTNKVYVANGGSNTVSVIDGSSNNVIATIPVGSSPLTVTADSKSHRVYVTNFFSNNLSVIDSSSDTVITTIAVGNGPVGVDVDPNSNKVFVSSIFTGKVFVIDGSSDVVETTVKVGTNPGTLAVDSNTKRVYVVNTGSNSVSVIDDTINLVIATISVGNGPAGVKVNENTERVYVANSGSNTVSVIDGLLGSPSENTVVATIPVEVGPIGMDLNPNIPNPVRDPSTDIKDGSGNILQCSYLGKHPHLSKFAVGGIIRPILAILGSGGGNTAAPTLDLTSMASNGLLPDSIKTQVLNHDPLKPIPPANETGFDFPFYLGGDGYAIGGFTNTIVTKTESTGIPVEIKLNIPSSSLEHVALYTNLRGETREIDDSDTYIIYEKGQPLQIVDPHGYFGNVKFDLSKDGIKNTMILKIIFSKPMEQSDIVLRMWDAQRSSSETKILDAWQVIKAPEQAVPSLTATNSIMQNTPPNSSNNSDKVIDLIKMWSGYSPDSISDSELLDRMGFEGTYIPTWFTKTTKWFVSGETSEQEFVEAIKFMSENGIIK